MMGAPRALTWRRGRSPDRGTASIEFIWMTILVLVPFVYIMLAVFDAQRAAYGVSTASRSAARAFILAPDSATARTRADAAARIALADQDVQANVTVTCLPDPASCLQPGSSVRVTVDTRQPLPLTPTVLGDSIAAITVSSSHDEPYGTYRSGR